MLKARQVARAKTANAAVKGKEKVTEHRDFAAVKALRQKMFEQQRQYVSSTCIITYFSFLFSILPQLLLVRLTLQKVNF